MIVVEPLVVAVLILALLTASITDILSHKIPNWITYPVIILALLAYSTISGSKGLIFSAEGLGLGLVLLLPFYAAGGMGAGDVKLMTAVGAVLGPGKLLGAFVCTGIAGGFWAAAVILSPPWRIRDLVSGFYAALRTFVLTKTLSFSGLKQGGLKLRYGVAISIGTLAYIFFEIYTGKISFHLV